MIRWSTRLERAGRSRTTAVVMVFGLMTLIVVLALLVIVPLLEDQVAQVDRLAAALTPVVRRRRRSRGWRTAPA